MNCRNKIRHMFNLTGILTVLITLCSSCMYDKEFQYTNDQINALKKTTGELQDIIDTRIESVHANQAAIRIEIEELKKYIREITGRVEDNERLIQHSIEEDSNEKSTFRNEVSRLREMSEKVDRLEKLLKYHQEYLNLGTFNPDTDTDVTAGESGAEGAATSGAPRSEDEALYETSLAFYKKEDYSQALKGFKTFIETYPKSDLADSAYFWIGECFMAFKEYKNAILAYDKVIENYPNGNEVPRAMLRQSIAWLEYGDKINSETLLKKVLKKYPDSPEAKIAEKKLSSIK